MGAQSVTFKYTNSTTKALTTAYPGTPLALTSQANQFTAGEMGSIFIYTTSLASSAGLSLTWFITRDAAGDEVLIPETDTPLIPGMTTPTSGTAVENLGVLLPSMGTANSLNTVYLWAKIDVGACTISECVISFVATGY